MQWFLLGTNPDVWVNSTIRWMISNVGMLTPYDLHHQITPVNYMFSLSFCHWSGKRLLCFWIYVIYVLFLFFSGHFVVLNLWRSWQTFLKAQPLGEDLTFCFCRCLIIFKLLRWSCNFTVVKTNRLLFPFHEGCMEKLCKFTYVLWWCTVSVFNAVY